MFNKNDVSMSVIRRLPRYYRFLDKLLKKDILKISSRELSEIMGITASQIRQDFHCFGGFGQQGYGYNVKILHESIESILNIASIKKSILIGAGNLGRAIVSYANFKDKGFKIVGVFDKDPNLIGKNIGNYFIEDIKLLCEYCKKYKPTVAILCIPQASAEKLSKTLIDLGIKGFWNFSHYDFTKKFDKIAVENVHLSDSLLTLGFQVDNLSY